MRFILRRLAFYLVAFIVAATFNFLIPRLMPGNPADIMLAHAQGTIPPEGRDALMATFGFINEPLPVQYVEYLKSIFTWNFGLSVKFYPVPVTDLLMRALPWTLFLTGTATLLAYTLGTLFGIRAAWNRGGRFDSIMSPSALALQSIPPVVVALTTLFVFAVTLGLLPTGYAYDPSLSPSLSPSFLGSVAWHALMPVLSLALVFVGGYLVTMRNNMIGQLGEDYVHLAEAKGLSDARVRYNYAARNALLPSITAFAISLGGVFGGSLITEVVFNYPGLGNLLYVGIIARDFPLIQGQLLIMTLAMLVANFAVDLTYVVLDPRLRRA